jgi:uncharacterized protein (DUF2252 family)
VSSKAALVERIIKFNRGRDPERLALKYKAMQKDALAFFRGTCHLFCEDWPQTHTLNGAPVVWVCGDLHVENFGTYKGDNRLVYFDVADFDEALLAPCTWDLTRLATSILIAAKAHGLKRKHALVLCSVLLDAYALALRDGKARWIERSTAQGLVGAVFQKLESTTRLAFIKQRTKLKAGKLELRIDGKHTLFIADDDRQRLKHFMREFAAKQADPKFFKMVDVARRVAGTGSLGLERYTILINGRGMPGGHFLLDLKCAPVSALARYVRTKQPRWDNEAVRVVEVQKRMQAIAPALLQATTIGSRAYVLRELMPTQDKLDLDAWDGRMAGLELLARDLGFVVAWSELRSGGRGGSATIDELISFAAKRRWAESVVDYAEHYQELAWSDWKRFRTAYQDGAFSDR